MNGIEARAVGVVLALLTAAALAWKWKLGVPRCTAVVAALGLLSFLAAAVIEAWGGRSAILQVLVAWGLTVAASAGVLAWRFSRDPPRHPPQATGIVVSPADGTVIYVEAVKDGMLPVSRKDGRSYALAELTGSPPAASDGVVIGIAMSFADVHVNRAPIGGTVVLRRHFPGRFGSLRKTAMRFENERATTVIEQPGIQAAVVQIASRLVRQIAVFVREGQAVGQGERLGVIRLGSQVDLVLQGLSAVRVRVKPGDRVRAGESIVAMLGRRAPGAPLSHEPGGALILGGDCRGLCIARSLGRRGIPIELLEASGEFPAAASRYVRSSAPWPPGDDPLQVEALLDLVRRRGLKGWAVFPTTDRTAAFLARNADRLSPMLTLTTAGWDVLRRAWDKRLAYALARDTGVPIPFTWTVPGRDDLAAAELSYPLVIKPAIKDADNPLTWARAWRVDDRCQLLERYDLACRLMPPDQVLVQELIPGGGEGQYSFAALCDEGRTVASLTARRLRQYPLDFGRSSSFVQTVERPDVEEAGRRLLAALRYTGLAEVEMKLDPRDGRVKLLDLNPRAWTWLALGARAGVDFPSLLWDQVCQVPVPAVRGRIGVSWIRLGTDLPSALIHVLRGQLSIRAWLRSLAGPRAFSVLDPDDLLPFFVSPPRFLAGAWARFLRRRGLPRRRGDAAPSPREVETGQVSDLRERR